MSGQVEIKLSTIGQLEIGGETEFGTATTDLEYVECLTADLSGLTAASLRDDALRQKDTEAERIPGVKTGGLTTTHYLHGHSSTLPTGYLYQQPTGPANGWDVLMSIMARALGGIVTGGYNGTSTVGGSATPPRINVADTGGGLSGFGVGEAIAWETGATDKPYEIGWLTDIATGADPDVGTLLQTPDDDPSGSKIWGGYNVFKVTGDPYVGTTDAPVSYTVVYSRDDGTKCVMTGCVPSQVSFTLTAGELPTITIEWLVGSWTETTGATLTSQNMLNSTGGSSDGAAVPGPEATAQWLVRYGSGSSVKDLTTATVEITLGLEVQPVAGGYSNGGIESFYTSKRSPMVTVRIPRVFADEATDWENQTGAPLQIQVGSQPGRMWGLAIPNARIMERPAAEDENGAIYNTVQFYPCEYDGDTGSAASPPTTPVDSDMKLVWL